MFRARMTASVAAALAAAVVVTVASTASANDHVATRSPSISSTGAAHWVGAWAAAQQSGGPSATDKTYRQLIHTSIGGSSLRLRFSNAYGHKPLVLRDVTVALPSTPTGPGLDAKSVRHVRFASGASVTIPPGKEARSLPLSFDVPADKWLAVSFYAPGEHTSTTYHSQAWGVNWESLPSGTSQASDPSGSSFLPSFSWTYLAGLDVTAPMSVSTIVALGDSITDCMLSVPHANTRWPDLLNDRLVAQPGGQRFSVVNAGINGNEISEDYGDTADSGEAGMTRIARDVFSVPNVSTLIVFEGVNDIAQGVGADQIIGAYERIIGAAHQRGIRVLISTMTPTLGAMGAGHPNTDTFRNTRQKLNSWLEKNQRRFEGLLHFGEVVQDPVVTDIWNPLYTEGDQTHPNPLGLKVIADSIPLGLLRSPR